MAAVGRQVKRADSNMQRGGTRSTKEFSYYRLSFSSPHNSPTNSLDQMSDGSALEIFNPELGVNEASIQTDTLPEPLQDNLEEAQESENDVRPGLQSPDSGFGGPEHSVLNADKVDLENDVQEDILVDDPFPIEDDDISLPEGFFDEPEMVAESPQSDPYENIFDTLEQEPENIESIEVEPVQVIQNQPLDSSKATMNKVAANDGIGVISATDPRPSRRLPQRKSSVKTSFFESDACACSYCCCGDDSKSRSPSSMMSLSKMSSASGRTGYDPGRLLQHSYNVK